MPAAEHPPRRRWPPVRQRKHRPANPRMHARPTIRHQCRVAATGSRSGFACLSDEVPDPTKLPQMLPGNSNVANAIEPARLLMLSAITARIIALSR
jgi:hypothetical protein